MVGALKDCTTMPSITSAFGTFVQSLSQIGISILNAILGVLYAILAFGQTLFASVVQLGQSVLKCKCNVSSPIGTGKLMVCIQWVWIYSKASSDLLQVRHAASLQSAQGAGD